MPVKIEFQVVSCSGEDERFRANELNYHGPTVRGWRSPPNSTFPQEIILQLKVSTILHQIQILVHQYLIPQKIEICTSGRQDCDFLNENTSEVFEYLGFITFSDNQEMGFRSRELKSILIPSKKAKFVKLNIHTNHVNTKNTFNQVGLMAVNILGDEVQDDNEMNNNFCFHSATSFSSAVAYNSHYISPYDDLAFEMYVDQETAKIIKMIEYKKLKAVCEERFEYANRLKITLENLRAAGEILGLYEQEKKHAINLEDYDKAKMKKLQIDTFRQKVYTTLKIDRLLDSVNFLGENENDESIAFSNEDYENQDEDIINGRPSVRENMKILNQNDNYTNKVSLSTLQTTLQGSNYSPNHLIHSKSQTSFSERNQDLVSSAYCKTQTFSTSISNPQLHRYLQEARPKMGGGRFQSNHYYYYNEKKFRPSSELNRSIKFESNEDFPEAPKTPSTSNSSDADELSPPVSIRKPNFPLENLNMGRNNPNESLTQQNLKLAKDLEKNNVPRGFRNWNEYGLSKSPPERFSEKIQLKMPSGEPYKPRSRSTVPNVSKSSFEAYEDRMLPALKSYHGNEIVRVCQLAFDPPRKSTLNEREKKQAALPISVFGIEMIEKFFSKNFVDKEEGLKQLQQELRRIVSSTNEESIGTKNMSYNKTARAAIFLLHRALRDKVYSVYSCAAETVRLFFTEYVPQRVTSSEVARSVEKLLPELLTKSGDVTPRIHNMAAHTLLSMAECEEVRNLHIIPAQLSRPLTSSVHQRLALSRLEMVEQLILNHGISKDKRSGLTCRTLAEFGSSGLHHSAEAVRKVSERILIQVYKVNPRIVRKQLPPDDNVTRRNLLYRQLFQEFDFMDLQRKLNEQTVDHSLSVPVKEINEKIQSQCRYKINEDVNGGARLKENQEIPKRKSAIAQTTDLNKMTSLKNRGIPVYDKGENNLGKELNKSPIRGPEKPILKCPQQKSEGSSHLETKDVTTILTESKRDDKILKQFPSTLRRTVNEKNNYNKNNNVTLKFPSLTDSLETTKARMLLDQRKNVTLKKTEDEDCLKKPSMKTKRKPRRNDSVSSSNIPVPTFGSRRKYCVDKSKNLEKERKQEYPNKTCIKKPSRRILNSKSSVYSSPGDDKNTMESSLIKRRMHEKVQNGGEHEPVNHCPDKHNEKELISNRQVTIEMNRFSESMLESLRESDHSIFNRLEDQDEIQDNFKNCIFCLSPKRWTTEEALNNHYLKECPMLTSCDNCMEIIEISGFTNHLLVECSQKHLFQKCSICKEAVLEDLYDRHECSVSRQNETYKSRCPFCHANIGDGESNWRTHLMGKNICPNHPRPPLQNISTGDNF